MRALAVTPDQTAATVKELTEPLAQRDGDRELIQTIRLSVFTAIERVPPDATSELQCLVADFGADPADRDTIARLGAMLRAARLADH